MRRLLLSLFLTLAACDTTGVDEPIGLALYVGNQGNFSDNNGSVTRYEIDTGTVTQNAVPTVDGLVQAVYGSGNRLYVLLNYDDSFTTGRGRIDVFNVLTQQTVDQFDVRTPRGLAATVSTSVGPAEVLVSNLYDGTVTPLNLVSGTAGTPVAVGANPEGVATARGQTYVANSGFGSGTTLSVYGGARGEIIDEVEVCTGPRTLLVDADLDLWVVCPGSTDFATGDLTVPGTVVVLDTETNVVRTRFTFSAVIGSATFGADGAVPSNTTDREVYVIGDGSVLRFDATTNTLDAEIAVSGAPIGAIAYDAESGLLYLGRPDAAQPYGADGVVTVHNRSGAQLDQFGAGIAPSSLAFAVETPIIEG